MQSAVRRNTELTMLLLALMLGAGAMALVVLGIGGEDVPLATPIMGVIAVLYIVAHVVMRKVARQGDALILPLAALLNVLGLAAIYRLELAEEDAAFGAAQLTWTLIGVALFVVTLLMLRDYRALSGYKYVLGSLGVALLLLPAVPGIGREVHGAQLWVGVGGFQFQPGEFAKVLLVIFFASYLAERKELLAVASRRIGPLHLPDPKHFGPLLVMWGISLAIMFFQKDLGSSMLFFSIFLVMLYMATARFIYLSIGAVLFAVGAYIGYQMFSHVQTRVTVWVNAMDSRFISDEGFQIAQSWFALATGGLFGTGFGKGRPDLIPAAETDFIFSVIGEELGLMGTAAVVVCFILLVARGFRTALRTEEDVGRLLAAGLISILAIQTVIILAGVTRLLPLTGITLPFMSYGGSSLLSNFVLIAILIRISDQTASAPPPAATAEIMIGGRR